MRRRDAASARCTPPNRSRQVTFPVFGGAADVPVNGRFAEFLHSLGVPRWRAWIGALSGKGWWRMSGSPAMEGMTLAWFESQGLVSLTMKYEQLNR